MADLGRADAEGQCAERAVGARVAVAADDGLAGLGCAEFGPDDVHDATMLAVVTVQLEPECIAVILQCPDLFRRAFADDGQVLETAERHGGRRVIHRAQGQLGTPYADAFLAQHRERLRRRDLVDQVQVDVENRRGVGGLVLDEMFEPDFLE